MPYSRPTLSELINRKISDFNNRVSSSMTFLRRSFFQIMAYVVSGSEHLLYEFINFVKDQLFISTADAEHLERHGSEYGVRRDSGDKAKGATLAAGTVGTIIPAGSEVQTDDGLKYRTDIANTIGAGGTVSMDITAIEVGDDYNQDVGATLSFVSPISGVSSNTTVDSNAITAGDDTETDEEYRARVLLRKRFPPHGGIENDYEVWAKEYPGVTRAWAISEYQGIGTVGLIFVLDDEDDIFPTETIRDAVKAYLISHTDPVLGKTVGIPVTAEPGFFVPVSSSLTVNMTIAVSPNTTAIQTAVTSKLTDMILQKGGAAESVTIGDIYEAVMTSTGVEKGSVEYPTGDVTASTVEVHEIGTITFEDYNG